MSLRARRFAGARLAAQPLQSIPEQLQVALKNLREQNIAANREPVGDDFPDYISKHRDVRGSSKKVHLLADPRRISIDEFMPEDLSKVPANLEALEQLVAHPPRAVYDLSWDVDGAYNANTSVGRRESMRIAREAERGWQEIIPTLEEGAIVKNMPVGAARGDFERADLYMKYGFGPVQENGLQFGQVIDGKIVPLSPTLPMQEHVVHLADRAKSGGELELYGQLNDNAQALKKLTDDVNVMSTKRQASGYDDYYDDYDDYEDYDPRDYLTIDDMRTREENVQQGDRLFNNMLNETGGVRDDSPNVLRRQAKDLADPDFLVNESDAPSPSNIARLREAQLELNQNVRPNNPNQVLDRAQPRPLPRMIPPGEIQPPSLEGFRTRNLRSTPSNMRQMSPDSRRRILAARMRNTADDNPGDPVRNAISARDMAKREMVDMNQREDGGIGRVMQEQYNQTDIENLRALQVAHAQTPPNNAVARPPNFLENPLGPNRSNPNFVQTGDRIQNRRALTPEQQQAARELQPLNSAESDIRAELDIFEGGMRNMNNRGRALRAQRGFGLDGLTDGVRPQAAMPGRQALSILHQENAQPGTVDRPQLAQALVNLRQIRDNNFTAVRNAGAPQRELLEQANYGPPMPIQAVVDRVTPPNRPEVDSEVQQRWRSVGRWGTSPLVPDYDDIPF